MKVPIVERAYALAGSGKTPDVATLRLALAREQYGAEEIRVTFQGASLRVALRQLCSDIRKNQ